MGRYSAFWKRKKIVRDMLRESNVCQRCGCRLHLTPTGDERRPVRHVNGLLCTVCMFGPAKARGMEIKRLNRQRKRETKRATAQEAAAVPAQPAVEGEVPLV